MGDHIDPALASFRPDDLILWETSAITRYLDDSFGGTRLQPQDPIARARMDCWISMVNDTLYQIVVRDIVLPRFGIVAAEVCGARAWVPKHERPPELPGDDPADAGQAVA